MNKMMRRWAALTAMVMLALTIVACGGDESAGESSNAENQSQGESSKNETALDGYVFTFNGVNMTADMDAAPIIDALGEPVGYYEAASCAFEGLDKIYTYSNFRIETYPDGDKDYISAIILKDDLVSTPEGVSLFMKEADIIAAYGEADETTEAGDNKMLIYKKGDMKLSFTISGGEITAISYNTTVLG